MKVIVSACLLGCNCKYNGKNNLDPELAELLTLEEIIPVCPEVLGGLSVPREPSEIRDGIVILKDGTSVDSQFRRGASLAAETAVRGKADFAILQPRSPSCGVGQIYDGTFSGKLIGGNGVFAEVLIDAGITAVPSTDREMIKKLIKRFR
ncbi:MAG: DUF523 domain-containing protein [Clostridia bacterium]|nr:DUF523 domain-containing protein [Clostridia bacterium]